MDPDTRLLYHLLSASSLVKQNDSVELRVKETSIRRADAASGTSVQEYDGLAVGVTALLVALVDTVSSALAKGKRKCQNRALTKAYERRRLSVLRSSTVRSRDKLLSLFRDEQFILKIDRRATEQLFRFWR